jgi:hypothetical protein
MYCAISNHEVLVWHVARAMLRRCSTVCVTAFGGEVADENKAITHIMEAMKSRFDAVT